MPVYRLGPELAFPDPEDADPSGLLAVGGDLSPERLLLAYALGIFPWYSDDQPVLWHSPDPRTVILPAELHVLRSLERTLRRATYAVRLDTAFEAVVDACRSSPPPEGRARVHGPPAPPPRAAEQGRSPAPRPRLARHCLWFRLPAPR